jgi:ATP-dependent RNA circularization protein (DNA/RNA ligase family)
MLIKPLGHKSYGSIPHLPGSRLGVGDHHCHEGQSIIATIKTRDKFDKVIVQEKLDGSNCCVAKINGKIISLGRSGYPAEKSLYKIHHVFHKWVLENEERFDKLLKEGERVCGEFLAQAIGTRYELTHEPYVCFDILVKHERLNYETFEKRIKDNGFLVPRLIHMGEAYPIEKAIEDIKISGYGAIDEVEGVIYRVERKGVVDFITKYVKHHKQDGKYMEQDIWNIDITNYI